MDILDIVQLQDGVTLAIFLLLPPWLFYRLRAAGLVYGSLYLWWLETAAEEGAPSLVHQHVWMPYMSSWWSWGWLIALCYLLLWYGIAWLFRAFWRTLPRTPVDAPAPPTLWPRFNFHSYHPVERIGVVCALAYLVILWIVPSL